MEDDAYLEPSRKAQRAALLYLVICMVLIGSLALLPRYVTPGADASMEDFEAAGTLLILLALSVVLVACVVGVFWTAYFFRLGYRSFKYGIYPPSGTIVVVRTRVRTGKHAALAGYLSMAFATLLVASLVLAGYFLWLSYSVL